MKIELESPFKERWRKGYVVINKENRRQVVLYNAYWDRTTISYARYLMGVKLGYEVPREYEVDHVNNDKTDDRIENLQLLTRAENAAKTPRRKSLVHGTLTAVRYCSCELCKEAKRKYSREYKKRRNKTADLAQW